MTLSPGTRLGPYEIQSPIGAGGMGEVYRARDTRLDRTVAIKILPAAFAADADRRTRFEREAKTVAGLNHPHICTLHDVGEANGTTYLVMELLAGETLAQRLAKGPLPLDQALRVATEIADALTAAHKQHVVHRDLKPANVMLTKTGAKLLDFGLAKLKGSAAGVPAGSSLTTQEVATSAGTLVGTVPYMAPEQLEGKAADVRSDLFAFGAVLYEMVTGRRAFQGDSHASVISAIMSSQPPAISSLQPLTPPTLDRLVQRCLAKDPDTRWQSAVDVAAELRWIETGSGTAEKVAAARGWTGGDHRWAWTAAAVGIVIGAGALWWWAVRAPGAGGSPQQATHTQVTLDGNVISAALSPDGGTMAYMTGEMSKDIRLKVRDVAGGQAIEVWRGRIALPPQWMPDGKQILIRDEGGLQLVPRFGGTPRRLSVSAGAFPAISPDGTQLAREVGPGFEITTLDGGSSRKVAVADAQTVVGLRWSRSGERLALSGLTQQQASVVWTVNPDGGDLRLVYSCALGIPSFAWSPFDDVLYVQCNLSESSSTVWRIEDRRGQPPLATALLTGVTAGTLVDISADGDRLAHLRHVLRGSLWRLDLTGTGSAPTRITDLAGAVRRPRVSPRGEAIAATLGSDVVRIPIAGGEPVRVVEGASGSWSPDGARFAFARDRGQGWRVFVGDENGQQATEVADSTTDSEAFLGWLPDGRLAWRAGEAQRWLQNYWILDVASGRRELLIEQPPRAAWLQNVSFSPTGHLVAVHWTREREGLWVLTGPNRTERFLGAGLWPAGWSPDGRWIYAHRYGDREIVRVNADSGTVQPVGRFPEGALGLDACGQTPDRRVLVCSLVDPKTDVWIVDRFDPNARKK